MALRSRMRLAGAFGAVAMAVACGGTGFSQSGTDGGQDTPDVRTSTADSSKADTGSHPVHDSGSHSDAGGAKDATTDVLVKEEASHPLEADIPDHTTNDAIVSDAPPADALSDAVLTDATDAPMPFDAGHDAGPPCGYKVAVEGTGVFLVTAPTPAVGTCGTLGNPCTDLASAIAATTTTRSTIYVGDGTYSATAVAPFPTLREGLTLLGGWNVTLSASTGYKFAPTCTANATITSSAPTILNIDSTGTLGKTTTLDTLIFTSTAVATAGQSLYGVLAPGSVASTLILNDVSITVPSGGNGTSGTTPTTTGTKGAGGGCAAAAGGNGAIGGAGGPGSRTTYGPNGAIPGTTAQTGAPGAPGATGTAGTSGCSLEAEATQCNLPTGTTVKSCSVTVGGNVCTGVPEGGCGGGGGMAGSGGSPGGVSIALYVWSGALQLTGGALTSGNGGKGGNGGLGSAGGAGGAGDSTASETATYLPAGCSYSATKMLCEPITTSTVTAAAAGQQGMTGGQGGQGGAGAGGDTYSYFLGPTGTVTVPVVPVFTFGTGGAGGMSSQFNGPTGNAAFENPQ